ncbi:hypothetical protein PULV_b0495 [Pseudoalteromonas ulvae UL12]|uniref:Oxidoreductase-like domain-containing protein n=1 Tax=Pseudoalteromonas ulvae TaxID=107327 RepID=A0A244CLU3_PSEDV|nr:oxidoreductase-like domain-containing protein [Pseudoalteromonas ulvae]MBE0365823.1 hypothetical protein [Pseudoalteromonas ulvae UL12]OUL56518.1 hypothetical protein B1199_17815 [Pseudoalteromonas ulvae]
MSCATSTSAPQKPRPGDCCGGGSCCPCVWDEYKQALKEWKIKELKDSSSHQKS